MSGLPVLYEDNHLLVVNKPAGLITMGADAGDESAVTLAAAYLKARYNKPGNVFVGVVSRLDRMVTGVLLLTRTSKAASRLSEQFRERTTEKRYLAWVEGRWPTPDWTELVDWVNKDESAHRMQVVASSQAPAAQQASLRFRSLREARDRTLLEIELLTGRKHQIRLQFAAREHAILGDRKYGARTSFPEGIALHSHYLTIDHPTREERLTFTAPLPDYWPA